MCIRDSDRDGQPKDAAWAAPICELPAATIEALAVDLATHRSLVTATWSVQRQQYGEMAVWAVVALGALLGQIGLPGGGFGFGYGSVSYTHLDVYKRQTSVCSASCRPPGWAPSGSSRCPGTPTGRRSRDGSAPVSYTHLDVYKRQSSGSAR